MGAALVKYDRPLTPLTPGAPTGSSGFMLPTAGALGGSVNGSTSPLGLPVCEPQLCSFVFSQPCFPFANPLHVVDKLFPFGDLVPGAVLFPLAHKVRVKAEPTVFTDIFTVQNKNW